MMDTKQGDRETAPGTSASNMGRTRETCLEGARGLRGGMGPRPQAAGLCCEARPFGASPRRLQSYTVVNSPGEHGSSREAAMGEQALVVVDMQNGFLREGNLASDRCLEVLPAVVREVEQALAAGHKVVFTADTHEPDDAEFDIFPEHGVRG